MDRVAGLDVRALDRARISRDPRFDGRFFVAVTSTGIYCRPICPARSPKRSHIRYFPTAAAAAEAGFRPCLRCRPEAAPGSPAWLGTSAIVRRALRLIDDGALDAAPVEDLAERVGVGPRHLRRLFLTHIGASPVAVAQTRRLHFAKRLVDETRLRVADIAQAAGFGSVRRLNDLFRQTYRRSPRQLRRAPRRLAAGDDIVLTFGYAEPFDWPQLLGFFRARAIAGVEVVDADSYTRTVRTAEGCAVVRVTQRPARGALQLRVTGATPGSLMALATVARRVFDVAADPDRIRRAFSADRLLGPSVSRRPGIRVPGAWDPFECAVRAVIGQQVSLAAARTFAARLVARIGTRVADAGAVTHLFPAPDTVARADLSDIGLTGGRVRTLKALAQAIVDRRIDFTAAVPDTMASLRAVPGIGEWTAQYVALRALGDPDAFPAADLVLRRAANRGRDPIAAAELERRAERWRPWRGYAAQHLWQSAIASENGQS